MFISFPYLALIFLNPGNRIARDIGIIRTPLVNPVNSKAFAERSICSNNNRKSAVPKTSGEIHIILKEPTSINVFKNFRFSSTISKQRANEKDKFIKVANKATKIEFIADKISLSVGMTIFASPLEIIIRIGEKMNKQKRIIKKQSIQ